MIAPAPAGEAYVGIARGDRIESVHDVTACAVDRSGKVVCAIGQIDVPVFLRSTSKPFIASAILREGTAERFGLEPWEIAVIAASHNGEPYHVAAVESILRKIGLSESDLQCGPHAPYDPAAAAALIREGMPFSQIHNNCSGKHAGILALCRAVGADVANYLDVSNTAQQLILAFCARTAGVPVATLPLAVDGCGIPVYGLSMHDAALSFSRLATLSGLDARDTAALATVRAAMMAYPDFVGGTGEFDSAFMSAQPGNLVAKSGAEGVHGAAIVASGTGLALKVADGASRAVAPAALRILRTLGELDDVVLQRLNGFEERAIYNRAGRAVGRILAL